MSSLTPVFSPTFDLVEQAQPGRTNVNQTVSQALTDIGAGETFYDNLVEVAKC